MLGRLSEFLIFGLAPLMVAAVLLPGNALAEEKVISGEVLYRERIALPPNAVLTVQLADVSLADAPAAIIAEQTVDPAGQVPIKFELRFDPSVIQPKMSYAFQARITVEDQLWFITDTRHEVDPLTVNSPQTVLVKRVAQGDPSDASTPGIFDVEWIVEAIDGKPAADGVKSTLKIEADGQVSGRGGCNGYGGPAKVEGEKISFGNMRATLMACEQAAMDQEGRFFAALKEVEGYRIEDGRLVLADKDGKELVRLTKG